LKERGLQHSHMLVPKPKRQMHNKNLKSSNTKNTLSKHNILGRWKSLEREKNHVSCYNYTMQSNILNVRAFISNKRFRW